MYCLGFVIAVNLRNIKKKIVKPPPMALPNVEITMRYVRIIIASSCCFNFVCTITIKNNSDSNSN